MMGLRHIEQHHPHSGARDVLSDEGRLSPHELLEVASTYAVALVALFGAVVALGLW